MAMSLQQSKSRIKSISATQKITNAMELVSTSKLKKAKEIYFKIHPFKEEIFQIVSAVVANIQEEHPCLQPIQKGKKLYIIITSSLGLCGGYNNNIFKFSSANITLDDDCIIIGTKGIHYFKSRNYHVVEEFAETPTLDMKENISSTLTYKILKQFLSKEYQEVAIIYTEFINSLTFLPKKFTLLPLDKAMFPAQTMQKELLLEPTPEDVLDHLIPFYLTTMLKSFLMESMLSEQASRRTAMENATDNATELKDKLMLEYNKARQAAITQEISEISGSAEALSK